jgi:hypothetical protein
MVQTDIAQQSAECTQWRQTLRNYRDEFHDLQKKLRRIAATPSSKNRSQAMEHFENQFHIQLINIHDLKQAIKTHEQQLQTESTQENFSDTTLSHHEALYDQYTALDATLQNLRSDFNEFMSKDS